MNKIIDNFLKTGDKFMPETHLFDPKVGKYSACGPFTKTNDRINKFMSDGDIRHIYKNKLDQACFSHDLAYGSHRDLPSRTVSDKILMNRAYNVANDTSIDRYQRSLAEMVYQFFKRKSST